MKTAAGSASTLRPWRLVWWVALAVLGISMAAEAQVATGSYSGTGALHPITGLGFAPDVVQIKVRNLAITGAIRTSTMSGTKSVGPLEAGLIVSLDADGFTVTSNDTRVNSSTGCSGPCTYYWTAYDASADLVVSSYVGDGTLAADTQAITGVGFSVDWVMVIPETGNRIRNRTRFGGAGSNQIRDGALNFDTIPSLDTDGFTIQVGATPVESLNINGDTYHYIAINEVPGSVKVGTYLGDGSGPDTITGVGFQPEYVFLQSYDADFDAFHKTDKMPGALSGDFRNAMTTDRITALVPDGFQIGSHFGVNNSGTNFAYLAVNVTPTTQYRSIGIAPDYAVGTVTATNGSSSVSGAGTAWLTANRGRGDRITIAGNNYTILSVDSQTGITLTEPFTGESGSGLSYTIARKFQTLQDWEDCISFATAPTSVTSAPGGSGLGPFTVPAGTNRLLGFSTSYEDNFSAFPEISVTFGGVTMTRAVSQHVQNGSNTLRTAIFYLKDADIPAGSNSFVVTSGTPLAVRHSYGVLFDVDQVNPIVDTAQGTVIGGDLVSTSSFDVVAGSVTVSIAASGTAGSFNDGGWGTGWTEETEGVSGSYTSGGAAKLIASTGTEIATATFNAGANHQVIVALAFAPTGYCEGVFSADLTADGRAEVGIAYNDSVVPADPDLTAGVTIDGSTTDFDHDITLTAADGNRHYGIEGAGALLDLGGASANAFTVLDEFFTLEFLEITGGTGGSAGIEFTSISASNFGVVRNTLIHDMGGDGIRLTDTSQIVRIYNNFVYETRHNIIINGNITAGEIYNNTVYSGNHASEPSGIYGGAASHPEIILRNNIAHSNAFADFGFGGSPTDVDPTSSNNLSSDATALTYSPNAGSANGIQEPVLANMSFVDDAAPGIDLHIGTGSAAEDVGADLSAIFSWDIDGGARALVWDVGADDLDATTSVELVSFTAAPLDGAVALAWETASELDNLGFHLYRATEREGPYQRITGHVIPGLGSSPIGATYDYRDSGLANGVSYFYRLEDIETTGDRQLHGPVVATPGVLVAETPAPEPQPAPSRATYGNPTSGSFEVIARSRNEIEIVLVTGGFYFDPIEDGTAHIEIPDFFTVAEPGMPSLPVRRSWVDAVAGRNVELVSIRAEQVELVHGIVPSGAEAVEATASTRGVVRTRRRRVAARGNGHGAAAYPLEWARIVDVGFQGDTKKALIELAPLRWDDSRGGLVLARRVVVRVVFRGRDRRDQTLDGRRGRRPRVRSSQQTRAVLARFGTVEPGLYRVRYEEAPHALRRAVSTTKLRLSRQGESVAFHVTPRADHWAPGSTLYFVGDGEAGNPYGREAVYELEWSPNGAMMESVRAEASGADVDTYRHVIREERNLLYQAALVDAPDVWLWDVLMAPVAKSYPFTTSSLAASSEASRVRVRLQGASDLPAEHDHHVRVLVNGNFVGETEWDGKAPREIDIDLLPGVLVEGENTLELDNVGDTRAEYSMVMLNGFEVEYPRAVVADAGVFAGVFSTTGTAEFIGITNESVAVDVTRDPPRWLEPKASGARFHVEAGHRYLAASTPHSPRITTPPVSRLKKRQNRADYVIIGPAALLAEAEPLVELRRRQGLRVRAVPIEAIYSEFGFGEATPSSVRDFIAYAYHHWRAPSLRYVLLLGDGTFDFKDYMRTGVVNQVPPLMARTSYLWTASDPTYAAVNGDDILPDLAIGRLPAASTDEARAMVQKLIAYETGAVSLDGKVVLVADDPDDAGDFEADVNALVSTTLRGHDTTKIFLRARGAEGARRAVIDAFDEGPSLVSYVGHGGIHLWADEVLFDNAQVSLLAPQARQPIVVTMNCLNGYFHFPFFDSLSETLLKAEGKGAIAAFSPSGLSRNDAARRFHQALLEEVLSGKHGRLGDAVLAAQHRYAASGAFPELLSIYHLFGDPASTLR